MYSTKEKIRIFAVSILMVVVLAAGIGFMVATIGNDPDQATAESQNPITANGNTEESAAAESASEGAITVQTPAAPGETRAADESDPAVKAAVEIIGQIDDEDYVTLRSRAVYELKDSLNKEKIDAAKAEISEDWGERKTIGKSYVTELTSGGETWQIVETAVSYENAVVTYRITFNGSGKFAGLYIR